MIIEMTFQTTLFGDGQETVTVKFTEPKVYTDNAGNGLGTSQIKGDLSGFEYVDPLEAAKLEKAGQLSLMASLGVMALNLGISIIFGGSISAMWVMVNTI